MDVETEKGELLDLQMENRHLKDTITALREELEKKEIEIEGRTAVVNSYHEWGSREAPAGLKVWARAADGVVKAVRHSSLPVWGIMWHPERIHPFRREDLDLLRRVLDPQETP